MTTSKYFCLECFRNIILEQISLGNVLSVRESKKFLSEKKIVNKKLMII